MKRQQTEAALHRFFDECGDAVQDQSDVEPVLDRVWERLEWKADEFVSPPLPAAPPRPFRFAWAAGIGLVTVLVNALIWSQPFSIALKTANDDHSMWKSSARQARETLPVTVPTDVFELVSVKKVSPSSDAAKTASTYENMQLAFTGCAGGYLGRARLDPGRVTLPGMTVLTLVMVAYGKECALVEGGPSWARSGEYYDIEALLPAGTPRYTSQDVQTGNAPKLQSMFQNLLADRFRLVVKRELREMPVYVMTVANRERMKLSPDETVSVSFPPPPGLPAPKLGRGQSVRMVMPSEIQMAGHAISMSVFAKDLSLYAGRIVVDKTGVKDVFDIDLKFAREAAPPAAPVPPPTPQSIPPVPGTPQSEAPLPAAPLRNALEEQLGLKLESARMPIEVLVIESVERPAEN
jgi:uncharacterized protein (TIGR03435 family)